jgi:hypothetical protein
LQDDIKTIEAELVAVRKMDPPHPEAGEALVSRVESGFLGGAKETLRVLETSLAACEQLIKSTLAQFGYKASSDEDLSKGFFTTIVEIISLTKKSSEDVDKWIEQDRKAAEKAAKLESKQSASSAKASSSSSSEKEVDKKDQQNIFGNFRDQQQASSDDIILQLKKKMELRRLKAEALQ